MSLVPACKDCADKVLRLELGIEAITNGNQEEPRCFGRGERGGRPAVVLRVKTGAERWCGYPHCCALCLTLAVVLTAVWLILHMTIPSLIL